MDATLNAQIWKQDISPFAVEHPVSNSGYTAIAVDSTVNGVGVIFNGLFKQGSATDPYPNHNATYLYCTSGYDWWYPVAAKSYFYQSSFPTVYNPSIGQNYRDTIELWAYTHNSFP